jgi:hypothetical protein
MSRYLYKVLFIKHYIDIGALVSLKGIT